MEAVATSCGLRVRYKSRVEARAFANELLGEVVEFAALDLVLGRLGCVGKRLEQVRCVGCACYAGTAQATGQVTTALLVVPDGRPCLRRRGR